MKINDQRCNQKELTSYHIGDVIYVPGNDTCYLVCKNWLVIGEYKYFLVDLQSAEMGSGVTENLDRLFELYHDADEQLVTAELKITGGADDGRVD